MLSLFNLTVFAASCALLICAGVIIKRGKKELIKYLLAGIIVVIMDFAVEFAGTSIGDWTYYDSFFHIFGKIPVELIILFFSAGVIARYLWKGGHKLKLQFENTTINYNHILYVTILVSFVLLIRQLLLYQTVELIIFAIPVGLWGILNINRENLEATLLLAIAVFIADFIAEVLIISSGSYSYAGGFSIVTPFVYSLLLIGFFGLMEKSHKLDRFLDSKVVRLLIKRSVFERRKQIKKIMQKVRKKLNQF